MRMTFHLVALCVLSVLTSLIMRSESTAQLMGTSGDVNRRLIREASTDTSSSLFYYQEPKYPRDCKEVYEQCETVTESGIYWIQPNDAEEPFTVFCNNSIDGGGWTVFQRRQDGLIDFYRPWSEYKKGFGFKDGEFWLGNDKISQLTNQKDYELRIDMNNVDGDPYFAKYSFFRISDEWSKYRIDLGRYLSDSTAARDSLDHHRNMSFSTYDRDNDIHSSHCAANHYGAWWYYNCDYSSLNSGYFATSEQSIEWYNLPGGHYQLKYTEMKVRPL